MADDIPLTKISLQVESKEVEGNDWNEQTFFPFQEDRERQQATIDRHAAAFPKLGIGALIGALTLVALSGGLLLVIQGPGKVVSDWTVHVYKTHRFVTIPKPAAWLSGVLSAISVCFHIALSEGLNIAWWYHVRQEDATVRDLHDIWGHGTSTWTVVKSGAKDFRNGIVSLGKKAMNGQAKGPPYIHRKHFSYVALATLFVATIPLNGFLLQNAVIVESVPASTNATVKIPMLDGDNFGNAQVYATGDESDGGVTDWSVMLGQLSQIVTPKVSAIADLGAYNTTCLGSCKTTVRGMGFKVNCEESEQPYTIPLNSDDSSDPTLNSMIANGTDVLSVAVTYHYLNINRITLRTLWKNNAACKGNYSVQTCTLDLATVEYPIVINANVKEATSAGLHDTTIMTLDMDLLSKSPKVLTTASGTSSEGSEYPVAGLAGLFAQTLNSTINLRYQTGQPFYSVSASGLFAQQQLATTGSTSFQSAFYSTSQSCHGTLHNITTQALATIQSMTFQLGAYNWLKMYGNPAQGYNLPPPQPLATQSYTRNEYRVVWAWYFGAMTVTLVVSLCILPTFWGYWRLERKTTMSPFETARAFHAPMLYQEDSRVVSEDLIKRVGDVRIHRDLHVVAVPPQSSGRAGGTW